MLHGEIAETLEAISADHSDQFALQLARHFDEAGNAEKAFPIGPWQGTRLIRSMHRMKRSQLTPVRWSLAKRSTISSEQLHHLYTRRGRAMELTGQFEQALEKLR